VLWSLFVCFAVVAAVRGWSELRAALSVPRQVVTLTVGAVLLAVNWGVYVYAVNSGQVVEASLGYYINPLVTVLLGVVVLRERLRPLQWAAVGVGAAAVAVLTGAYGHPPFIALTLAGSFGLYGLIKNRVGANVGAVTSLTTETLVLALPAAGLLVWLEVDGQGHFTRERAVAGAAARVRRRRDRRARAVLRGRGTPGPAVDDRAAAVHDAHAAAALRRAAAGRAHVAGALGGLRARLGRARDADRRHAAGRLEAPDRTSGGRARRAA
jgi:uncharacterized membrane protein